jgi:SAM-dependent methyltransferase
MDNMEGIKATSYNDRTSIAGGRDRTSILARAQGYIDYANERLEADVPHGAAILDFGCGSARVVAALQELGYDAWGVDIDETWGSENEAADYVVPPEIIPRLRIVDRDPYRIPFPDNSFDFVLSEQTLEHVSEYEPVFREILRVLKPAAISVHRFPGPFNPVEGHTNVPIPAFCHNKAWLALWAIIGRRVKWRDRQLGFTWRQTLDDNINLMLGNHYPSKHTLLQCAGAANGKAIFRQRDELLWRGGGKLNKFPFRNAASYVLSPAIQNYMVLVPRQHKLDQIG